MPGNINFSKFWAFVGRSVIETLCFWRLAMIISIMTCSLIKDDENEKSDDNAFWLHPPPSALEGEHSAPDCK